MYAVGKGVGPIERVREREQKERERERGIAKIMPNGGLMPHNFSNVHGLCK